MYKVTVVNVRKQKSTHYCGRETSYKSDYGVNLSTLGNPFPISNTINRDQVIQQYEKLFYTKDYIEYHDKEFKILLEYLKTNSVELGCFCHPQKCHCDIIADFINKCYQKYKEI